MKAFHFWKKSKSAKQSTVQMTPTQAFLKKNGEHVYKINKR